MLRTDPSARRALLFALLAGLLAPKSSRSDVPGRTREILSPVYTVDRLYRSMTGPQSTRQLQLGEGEEPELLWITGYEAVMVGRNGTTVNGRRLNAEVAQRLRHLDEVEIGKHRFFLLAGRYRDTPKNRAV